MFKVSKNNKSPPSHGQADMRLRITINKSENTAGIDKPDEA